MKFFLFVDETAEEEVVVRAKRPSRLTAAIEELVKGEMTELVGYTEGSAVPFTADEAFCFSAQEVTISGGQLLTAVLSTYLLAFVQAGATVFNQIEEWPLTKSLLCHLSLLYAAYVSCYLINSWIPFIPMVLVIFTAIFLIAYFVIWLTVYFCVKAAEKNLMQSLISP